MPMASDGGDVRRWTIRPGGPEAIVCSPEQVQNAQPLVIVPELELLNGLRRSISSDIPAGFSRARRPRRAWSPMRTASRKSNSMANASLVVPCNGDGHGDRN
jgi:hypothetical protein